MSFPHLWIRRRFRVVRRGAVHRALRSAIPIVAVSLAGLVCFDKRLAAADSPVATARFVDNKSAKGVLRGGSPGELHVLVDDKPPGRPLTDVKRLEFPGGARVIPLRGSPRQLRLLGDESFPVGGVRFEAGRLWSVPLGGESIAVPLGVVGLVRHPAGELEFQVDDAESAAPVDAEFEIPLPRSDLQAWSGKFSFAVPVGIDVAVLRSTSRAAAGGTTMAWLSSPGNGAGANGRIVAVFGEGESSQRLTIQIAGATGEVTATASTGWPMEFQSVRNKSGWQQLSVLFNKRRVVVLVDQQVIASGEAANRRFTELRVQTDDADKADRNGGGPQQPIAWLDDLREFESFEPFPPPRFPATHDTLWLASGDELLTPLFGTSANNVGTVPDSINDAIDWRNLWGVLPQRRLCPPSATVSGWIAAVELAPRYGESVDGDSSIVAAVQSADDGEVMLQHPWLGRLAIPQESISRITPLHRGSLRILDPTPHHLGNNTRPNWKVPLPEGTEFVLEFELEDELKTGAKAHLGLTVVELEPFGGTFAVQGKYHQELAAGGLRTTVWVNDRNLGDLNSLLDGPATHRAPRRLLIPVPEGVLRKGANRVRLIQNAATKDRRQFDDFEASRLTLEVEDP